MNNLPTALTLKANHLTLHTACHASIVSLSSFSYITFSQTTYHDDDCLTFEAPSPLLKGGYCTLSFTYQSIDQIEQRHLIYTNGQTHVIFCPPAKDWSVAEIKIYLSSDQPFSFCFQKQLGALCIKEFSLSPAEEPLQPVLLLKHFVFWQNDPCDLTTLLSHAPHAIQALYDGQSELAPEFYTVKTVNATEQDLTISKEYFASLHTQTGTLFIVCKDNTRFALPYYICSETPSTPPHQIRHYMLEGNVTQEHTEDSRYRCFKMGNTGKLKFRLKISKEGLYGLQYFLKTSQPYLPYRITVHSETAHHEYGAGYALVPNRELFTQKIHLYKGINLIEFSCEADTLWISPFSFDSRLITCKIAPEVSPRYHCFCKDNPRDLDIHLEHNNHVLSTIILDQKQDVPFFLLPFHTEELDSGHALAHHVIRIPEASLAKCEEGDHLLTLLFDSGSTSVCHLTVNSVHPTGGLSILSFDADHGNATLISFPNGKHLLIDSGKPEFAQFRLLPFLEKTGIKIDYYLITHYHDDHTGEMEHIITRYSLAMPPDTISADAPKTTIRIPALRKATCLDNRQLAPMDNLKDIWDIGDVDITILTSAVSFDGTQRVEVNENNISISFMLEYQGFRYLHSSDIYPVEQENLLRLLGRDFFISHYLQANHHFHGPLHKDFLKLCTPVCVFIPANGAVYARDCYTGLYKNEIVPFYLSEHPQFKDTLLSCEIGSVMLYVQSGSDWNYETLSSFSDLTSLYTKQKHLSAVFR